MIKRKQLIESYIEFFKKKNHKEILNSSLIPENDPTVLFTTAGMHPLVPYLLGQLHPSGKRLCNVQRCIRTGDIEEVGNTTHHTFFEMLGNWSLGDYWKKEAIEYSFEFLTKILKIPIKKLAVSIFAGNKDAGKDEDSFRIWEKLGIPRERIAFLPKQGLAGQILRCFIIKKKILQKSLILRIKTGWKYGMMFLCSIIKMIKRIIIPQNKKILTLVWVLKEPWRC